MIRFLFLCSLTVWAASAQESGSGDAVNPQATVACYAHAAHDDVLCMAETQKHGDFDIELLHEAIVNLQPVIQSLWNTMDETDGDQVREVRAQPVCGGC